MNIREEKDKIGSLSVERDALYGIQTVRASNNFAISNNHVRLELVYAMVTIKKAAAMTHKELKLLDDKIASAIIEACDRALRGEVNDAFITNALQGGAGTSTNMNVNEVIANLALNHLGLPLGDYQSIHPLDHVNKGQSTNDVYPTALRIAAIKEIRALSDECSKLQESLQKKELEYADILKLGRTELMDALPITLGQEFGAYAQAISRDRWRIYKVEERLRQINLGGTAVGTGSNTNRKFTYRVTDILRELTDMGLARAEYPMDLTQNNDVFVEVSGLLKALAVNLMKISTDLRLMNSGPYGGFGEITLEELQAGSTIMPGKVNPVIPEMVTQVAIKVMSNDNAITLCAASGNFELNAFMPLIADSLLESLSLLTHTLAIFRTKCIETLTPNVEACRAHLDRSLVLATSLAPYIGYENVAFLIKECGSDATKIRELVLQKELLDEQTLDKLLNYRHEMTYLV
ncbi:aspartate ammonia-lyase [Cellulosilyticum sp. I15G10I2]|uniref:aspartate ammonia-lyase n=1 Tax=Cellulosilyticum sp. I15G10I2 TaxID=1892843 RepID=UPI00085CDF63|nr:aspartate ammonia-lyase [Cellulosilyticum sp. I15G10I2]